MNFLVWVAIASCLVHQGNCGFYWVQIESIKSSDKAVEVSYDDPKKGEFKLTLTEDRLGSTFIARVLEKGLIERGPVKGSVCETYEKDTPEHFITHIIYDLLKLEGCPIPAGEYQVERGFKRENVNFDIMPEGFNRGIIRIQIFNEDNERQYYPDVVISARLDEWTEGTAEYFRLMDKYGN